MAAKEWSSDLTPEAKGTSCLCYEHLLLPLPVIGSLALVPCPETSVLGVPTRWARQILTVPAEWVSCRTLADPAALSYRHNSLWYFLLCISHLCT